MKFTGTINILGDKSIAHRALILCSWFKGTHIIKNLPLNEDVLTTLSALESYGLRYVLNGHNISIDSSKFKFKEADINCNDSGTSARLLCGYLAGGKAKGAIFGSKALSNRPMRRICDPLNNFGANLESINGFLPIKIKPSTRFDTFDYDLKIPSAQIKASLILYAMFMRGESTISGLVKTRDHLENLLSYFSYPITIQDNKINVKGSDRLSKNLSIELPGDISSAAFIIGGAILLKGSSVQINNICFNKYRIGFIDKLIEMGANIAIKNKRNIYGEDVADITASYSPDLVGVKITSEFLPLMIDEIPIMCVIAAYAKGETIIEGIDELRVKESDRVEAIMCNMKKMNGLVHLVGDNLVITPKNKLHNTTIRSFGDHRIFMAFYIANLVSDQDFNTKTQDSCYKKSFTNFFDILEKVIA